MKRFWMKYRYRILGAIFGVLFHLGLFHGIATGKGLVGLVLIIFYFPILIFLYVLGYFSPIFGNEWFEISVAIGGSVMYALLGWKVGPFVKRCGAYAPTPPKPEQSPLNDQSETNKENQP